MSEERVQHDVLVVAKTVATTRFPFETPSVLGIDRASGGLLRLAPFPFGARDTEPPIAKWSWLQADLRRATMDPRPDSLETAGELRVVGYVDAKEAWKLRWPFVRPHLRESLEALGPLAAGGVASAGFVRPAAGARLEVDSLTLRFRCDAKSCQDEHALPVLDWEVRETIRAAHEKTPLAWREKAESMWGPALFERFDVHLLLSTFAQAPGRFYVAGLFYPPRERESAEAHAAHATRR